MARVCEGCLCLVISGLVVERVLCFPALDTGVLLVVLLLCLFGWLRKFHKDFTTFLRDV